ncbi:hypothetical protein CPC16_010707 [Podila verticillata]|nr:hypothetical protein BGZ52_011371 [Haplosporangium bisporale]KAF9214929.1 hypothetical protein BGZ59_002674 [Podila verticillata]KAF9379530.1 hypothetical protein CPC16_010707 [Podila verticillata]KAI9242315.1 MAG: hypothetical protein BYD32DRAFT_403874 [Podila humilis]KFH72112.1 hypothetical protein MVEG_02405 [Podila verticillata NRRL 6337]
MKFSVVALAGSLMSAASVFAQVYPTAPITTTVWKAGAAVTVTWKWNPTPVTTPLDVTLFTGEITHQTQVVQLGTSVANAVSLKVTLPADLASSWYSLRIGTDWSAPFIIQGTGPVPTGPAPTAATSTAALPTANTTTASVTLTSATATSTTTKPATTSTSTTSGASVLSASMALAAGAMVAVSMAL